MSGSSSDGRSRTMARISQVQALAKAVQYPVRTNGLIEIPEELRDRCAAGREKKARTFLSWMPAGAKSSATGSKPLRIRRTCRPRTWRSPPRSGPPGPGFARPEMTTGKLPAGNRHPGLRKGHGMTTDGRCGRGCGGEASRVQHGRRVGCCRSWPGWGSHVPGS